MTPVPPSRGRTEAQLDFGRFAGLGLRFVVTIALFGLLGWWVDGRLGWAPWLLVAGILAGSVVAFISIVRAVPPAKNLHLDPLPLDDQPDDPDDPDDPDWADRADRADRDRS